MESGTKPVVFLPLAKHFYSYFAHNDKRIPSKITRTEKQKLTNYYWPGNVRELMNLIESSILLSNGNHLEINFSSDPTTGPNTHFIQKPTLDELEKQYIEYVLAETRGQVGGSNGEADVLGIKRTTLNARMKKLGISPGSFRD